MRVLLLILALAACGKGEPRDGKGEGSAPVAPTREIPAGKGYYDDPAGGAATADAAAPTLDAAPAGPAPVDSDRLLDVETIGPLKFGMSQAAAIKVLGPPGEKTFPQEEAATGEFASTWSWSDVKLEMVSATRQGAAKVRMITSKSPNYTTRRGIKIGSTRTEVAAAYPKSDEGGDDPTQFLVGSPYGGLLFILQNDAVAEMVLGPLAF